MMESVISPLNERETLSIWQRLMDLKKIDRISVSESDKLISDTVFPDGEDPHEAVMSFLVHSFLEGKVLRVHECTSEHAVPFEIKNSKT
jgi:hypothetical protein